MGTAVDAAISLNNLRELRQAKGLAQYGLAALAGVSPTTISATERWAYRPTLAVRQRLAAALGVEERTIWPPEEPAA